MTRRLYWGVGLLILLLIAGGTFLFYSQYNELQQLKQETAEADKLLEEHNKPIADNEPPDAREGFKMVKHDDHFHEVPIDAPDVWEEQPHEVVETANKSSDLPIGIKRLPIDAQTSETSSAPKYEGILTVEEYEVLLTEEYKNVKRDKNGLLRQSLPEPPRPANFSNNEDYEKASKVYITLMRVEAENVLNRLEVNRSESDE